MAIAGTGTIGVLNVGAVGATGIVKVTGQIYSTVFDNGSSTAIDWNNGNVQITSTNTAALTFSNVVEGGAYTLICTGTTAVTHTFSQTSAPDTLAAGVFSYYPTNANTSASAKTVYTFLRAGNAVYTSWITGFP